MAQVQVIALGRKVQIDVAQGEITVLAPLDSDETELLTSCVKTPAAKARVVAIVNLVRATEMAFGGSGKPRAFSPYARGLDFRVPRLCVQENGEMFEFESTFLLEHPWKLSTQGCHAGRRLPSAAPANRQGGRARHRRQGEVVCLTAAKEMRADFIATLPQQVLDLGSAGDWSLEAWWPGSTAILSATIFPGRIGRVPAQGGARPYGPLAKSPMSAPSPWTASGCVRKWRSGLTSIAGPSAGPRFQAFLLPQSVLAVSDGRDQLQDMGYEPSWLYEGAFRFPKALLRPQAGRIAQLT
ncbi:hypothetical protein [Candidatus Amarobacter glycogenicus]|uniref:hypothetical protein n=1 Tax=Candidatus Amarobacter glycogenicus TaxID=3140699 RepID=UPI0031365222|nr:hypothetical protein [Dehalococcoidia bacterium]